MSQRTVNVSSASRGGGGNSHSPSPGHATMSQSIGPRAPLTVDELLQSGEVSLTDSDTISNSRKKNLAMLGRNSPIAASTPVLSSSLKGDSNDEVTVLQASHSAGALPRIQVAQVHSRNSPPPQAPLSDRGPQSHSGSKSGSHIAGGGKRGMLMRTEKAYFSINATEGDMAVNITPALSATPREGSSIVHSTATSSPRDHTSLRSSPTDSPLLQTPVASPRDLDGTDARSAPARMAGLRDWLKRPVRASVAGEDQAVPLTGGDGAPVPATFEELRREAVRLANSGGSSPLPAPSNSPMASPKPSTTGPSVALTKLAASPSPMLTASKPPSLGDIPAEARGTVYSKLPKSPLLVNDPNAFKTLAQGIKPASSSALAAVRTSNPAISEDEGDNYKTAFTFIPPMRPKPDNILPTAPAAAAVSQEEGDNYKTAFTFIPPLRPKPEAASTLAPAPAPASVSNSEGDNYKTAFTFIPLMRLKPESAEASPHAPARQAASQSSLSVSGEYVTALPTTLHSKPYSKVGAESSAPPVQPEGDPTGSSRSSGGAAARDLGGTVYAPLPKSPHILSKPTTYAHAQVPLPSAPTTGAMQLETSKSEPLQPSTATTAPISGDGTSWQEFLVATGNPDLKASGPYVPALPKSPLLVSDPSLFADAARAKPGRPVANNALRVSPGRPPHGSAPDVYGAIPPLPMENRQKLSKSEASVSTSDAGTFNGRMAIKRPSKHS